MALYFCKLIDSRNGTIYAGGHFKGETAFEARKIAEADFRRTMPDDFIWHADIGIISQRSTASMANTLN